MMKFFISLVGYMATAMAFCAVLFRFAGMWSDEEASARRFAHSLVFEMRRSQALGYRADASNKCWMAKVRIINELSGGRLRLREAIDQLQRINEELIETLTSEDMDQGMVAAWVPVPNDPKSVGQYILEGVRAYVASWPPDQAKRLLADLERDFRELFG